ncbi:ATP-dependent DNA helicase, RecQ family [Candidatus Moduliflexus flocculans]|uniref:DNA 3'-5' helicase n=1 Tax=Candidatus Moduliflexus flocculans TaxID=1499966 RepID=A0A0S6W195_9BACT|nr:ATP-dependent DNA helicase, RecQ family [Candidatus Moduliflexus flocculans]
MSDIAIFISECVAIDLEIHPETKALLKIGAVRPDANKTLSFQGQFNLSHAVKALDEFCQNATFLIGHNISRHDLPYLKQEYPHLSLCALPLIDTLFLSPLAFPKNPYHRLIKDYKIVKESVNDPVADARCTISLFRDQWAAFEQMNGNVLGLYGALLSRSFPADRYQHLFESLTHASLPDPHQSRLIWEQAIAGRACQQQATAIFEQLHDQPADAASLAYMLAWIQVAGENSVLPPWVRHQFPRIPDLLDALRGTPCLQPDCAYCTRFHDPVRHLQQWFGKPMFRGIKDELPPIQQQIVETLIRGENCLAILPTGFGKSVCYQLPALMKAIQRNQLTLILSPLQSLMKDQVDNLKRNGILNVGTINGLLTMLERSHTLEAIRLGDIDILWIAPEQLRNATVKSVLRQREIGLIVIDEAHCFSKWGHDFRPDYLHIARFLREECLPEQHRLPQIACFTATAKKDVIEEIRAYFLEELALELRIFYGGHERPNLHYIAESIRENEKEEIVHERLTQIFQETHGTGGGIVFASTHSRVEKFHDALTERGWRVDHFHGGRTPDDKKRVQEQFLQGELQIIIATNAFGMGVDKPDVRVVIHADAPGSLENYLQEAGRAGRDGEDAWCYLLFNEEDLETQFKLSAQSRIEWRDMSGMLTGLKKLAAKSPEQTLVLTAGELLRNEQVEEELTDLSADEKMYDVKVKTALAWLERNGKLRRGDNRTHVIQGQVLVENLQQAKEIIDRLKLSHSEKSHWLTLLQALFQCDPKELVNTDQLSLATGLEARKLLSILHSMRETGIINHDLNMTARVYRGIANDSKKRFQKYCLLERALFDLMQEMEPDMSSETPCDLRLKEITSTQRSGRNRCQSARNQTYFKSDIRRAHSSQILSNG